MEEYSTDQEQKKEDGKRDLLSMYPAELEAFLTEISEKKFRARQIYDWLHVQHATSISQMTNLSKLLREKLESLACIDEPEPVEVLTSRLDGTKKYLFRMKDGNVIESVLMRYSYGLSVCISSQVGCSMGCRFCASTIGGRIRNLTASEMLGQVLQISRLEGERISHVVIMGSGEPLDNYDNLVRFLRIIGDPDGERLSLRDITVSTCGIVPNIYRLAEEGLPVTLALSLHASGQKERAHLLSILTTAEFAKNPQTGDVIEVVRWVQAVRNVHHPLILRIFSGVCHDTVIFFPLCDVALSGKSLATVVTGNGCSVVPIRYCSPVTVVMRHASLRLSTAKSLVVRAVSLTVVKRLPLSTV